MLPSRIYQDMVLTSIGVKRDATSGDGATFALEFKEIRQVAVKTSSVPVPAEPRAKPSKKRGAQNPKDIVVPAKKKSILKGIFS